jgi:hypothetical protein
LVPPCFVRMDNRQGNMQGHQGAGGGTMTTPRSATRRPPSGSCSRRSTRAAASASGGTTGSVQRSVALARWSHWRVVAPGLHFIPVLVTSELSLFLIQQCDRTLGAPRERGAGDVLRHAELGLAGRICRVGPHSGPTLRLESGFSGKRLSQRASSGPTVRILGQPCETNNACEM